MSKIVDLMKCTEYRNLCHWKASEIWGYIKMRKEVRDYEYQEKRRHTQLPWHRIARQVMDFATPSCAVIVLPLSTFSLQYKALAGTGHLNARLLRLHCSRILIINMPFILLQTYFFTFLFLLIILTVNYCTFYFNKFCHCDF